MRLTLRRPSAASPAVSRIAFDWRVSGTPTVFARAFGDLVVRPAQLVATLAIEGECEGLVAPESVTRRPCERAARSLIGSLRDAIESADMT